LNYYILKSAANAAYLPSFPSIPIPTSALYIIPTSLPPSPIHAIILLVYNFKFIVIYDFYVGEHLQHTTAGAILLTSINNLH